MLSDKKLEFIAKATVESLRIGRKPNPGIEKAKKRFGKIVDKLIKMKEFSIKKVTEEERKVVEKLKNPDYGPLLLEVKGKLRVKTEVGQTVRLAYSTVDKECAKLAQLIKEECWRRGVHVTDLTYSSAEERKHLQLIPIDTVAELPPISKILAGAYDVRIFLGGEEDINWMRGLETKVKLGAPASQKIRSIIDRKKVKWCYFGWPIKSKQLFVDRQKYKKVFYNSIFASFSPKVKKICEYYKKVLENADEVVITAKDGTDLTFSIKGRPVLVDDGKIDEDDIKRGDVGLNIPSGEVFVAPIEDSAEGYIKFDFTTIHGFGKVSDLEVEFKNGKIIWFDSPQKKIFKKFLDSNVGEKDRIAELGIGANPAAEYIGETIVDEKIFGSIHIAIGSNTGSYHGKNKASSHLDIIKLMGKGSRMFVDGKAVMIDGKPKTI